MTEDIRTWLENLGLGKHADAFIDNDVGPDVFAYLTEDHLEKLGVSIGNRLRLLNAIRDETADAPAITLPATIAPVVSDPTDTPPSAPLPSSDAERRPLTVMFCDLADSTALSTRLDPEDLQDVIRAYQETCTELIQEYEGYVARYMGDGILVYFGYPKSLERNAERAVRSALTIIEAMAGLNRTLGRDQDIEIAVRIGIATGMVVVGEVIGEGLAQERTVVGEAPNMAARFQSLAGRNRIVIGSLTKDLTGDGFVYEDMGSKELKGISGLVQTWGVVGLRDASVHEASLDENGSRAVLPELIGRDEETGLLLRAWQSVREEGRGQVAFISGEAGIGKSVLVDGLRAAVRAEDLPQVVMRCSPYHTNSALYPVIEYFKRLAGWQPDDGVEMRLGKLEAVLKTFDQPVSETVPLLAVLLTLPLPEDRYPPLVLSPQQQKQRTQDAFIAMILEAAERQSLLQLWEDLHWADPSTLELIGLLIDQAPTASLFMVLTARPEFTPPWQTRSHITPFTLNRLESQHAAALVARIAGMKSLPEEVVDHIVTKADGVPLYVEELTKTILNSNILNDTGERFELTGPLSSLAIPNTLQESLMARLDRLPQVRELAQLVSVLGREFAYEMISCLSTTGDSILQEGLCQLVDAELLYQRGRPPRARYIFKHALIQDEAYGSLLRRTREQHHLQVAQLLDSRFPDIIETNPELVAHHYSEAAQPEQAAAYWEMAGQRAAQRFANQEAIGHFEKGLAALAEIPESPERDIRELAIQTTLGSVNLAVKGYGAEEVVQAYSRARELCKGIDDQPRVFTVLWGLWLFHLGRAEHQTALELGEQVLGLAKQDGERSQLASSHVAIGVSRFYLADPKSAQTHFEQCLDVFDPVEHGNLAFQYGGIDMGVASLGYGSWAAWLLGYADRAARLDEQALAAKEKSPHPYTRSRALTWSSQIHQYLNDPDTVLERANAADAMATEMGFALIRAQASVMRGWARVAKGDGVDCVDEIRDGMTAWKTIGAGFTYPYFLGLLGDACRIAGRTDEGIKAVNEGLALAENTGEQVYDAELHRLKGELLLLRGKRGARQRAAACFETALQTARSQGSRAFELRAASSLARLWCDQNKADEARNLLRPVYDWFTEGFETAGLKDAKELLDGIA